MIEYKSYCIPHFCPIFRNIHKQAYVKQISLEKMHFHLKMPCNKTVESIWWIEEAWKQSRKSQSHYCVDWHAAVAAQLDEIHSATRWNLLNVFCYIKVTHIRRRIIIWKRKKMEKLNISESIKSAINVYIYTYWIVLSIKICRRHRVTKSSREGDDLLKIVCQHPHKLFYLSTFFF